jgi:hypothetical protein
MWCIFREKPVQIDWQLLGLSFGLVFLSELGDKSQLAAITLGGNARSPKVAFFGIAAGLVFTSFLGVLLGDGVAQLLPTPLLKAIAATGFAIMGLSLLWQRPTPLLISADLLSADLPTTAASPEPDPAMSDTATSDPAISNISQSDISTIEKK